MKMGYKVVLLLILSIFSACGGDTDRTEVEDIRIDENTLVVGERTVVGVEFSFDNFDIFNDSDEVYLTIRLPNGLIFAAGSGEIQGSFGDEDVEPEVLICDSGETVLVFELDDNDLDRAISPSRDADAELTFTVEGVNSLSVSEIGASASSSRPILSCTNSFLPQETERVQVL